MQGVSISTSYKCMHIAAQPQSSFCCIVGSLWDLYLQIAITQSRPSSSVDSCIGC